MSLSFEVYESDYTFGDPVKADLVFREWLGDIADFTVEKFQQHVPRGDSLRTFEAISRTNVEKFPGGYTVSIGIEMIEMVDKGESPYYPTMVHEGTGMFSDDPHWITPLHGNVMVFDVADARTESGSRTIFTRNVEGQEAQPYLNTIEDEVGAHIRLKKRELAALLNS